MRCKEEPSHIKEIASRRGGHDINVAHRACIPLKSRARSDAASRRARSRVTETEERVSLSLLLSSFTHYLRRKRNKRISQIDVVLLLLLLVTDLPPPQKAEEGEEEQS